MRNIYIDCGAYNGDTIKQFNNWKGLLGVGKWQIYAFEPNPAFHAQLKKADIKFDKRAIWISNTEKDFAIDNTENPFGSTLMRSKEIWQHSKKIKVKTLNFSNWLIKFKEDFVIVKMDIEGAEFPVIDKLLKDNTIDIISILFVEFHHNKIREYTTEYKNGLLKKINKKIEVYEWK